MIGNEGRWDQGRANRRPGTWGCGFGGQRRAELVQFRQRLPFAASFLTDLCLAIGAAFRYPLPDLIRARWTVFLLIRSKNFVHWNIFVGFSFDKLGEIFSRAAFANRTIADWRCLDRFS